MKLEIVLLLLIGMKPKKIAEKLNVKLWNIYYYNRQLKKAFKVIEEL